MSFSNYNGSDVEYEKQEEKKKFVLTRGKLILIILIILAVIISAIFIIVKNKPKKEEYTVSDFKRLEARMVEEAPNYLYQKQIELTTNEYQIDLRDLLEENGGTIISSKVKTVKVCDGYVSAIKKEKDEYKAYIKCGDLYTTKGYYKKDNEKTTTTKSKDKTKPVISLIGEKEITINTSEVYKEEGAKAIDNVDGDITSEIKIEGKVDSSKSGTYEIIYSVTDSSNNKAEVKRIIKVIDITPTTTLPKITTTASKITTTKTTTKKTTKKTTTQKNITTKKTTKRVTSPPKIILNGEHTITLIKGANYKDEGYTAFDALGNDITSKVIVKSNVNVNSVGTYNVTYTVSDSYGNTSSVIRIIKVKLGEIALKSLSVTPNSVTLKKDKKLSLTVTFDPSNATNKTVSYKSSNTSVVEVDTSGRITTKNKGTAYITVTSSNGLTAKTKVIVTN